MLNGIAIAVQRVGNGFEIRPRDDLNADHILIFESKKKLIRFIDSHFAEKRKKGEKE